MIDTTFTSSLDPALEAPAESDTTSDPSADPGDYVDVSGEAASEAAEISEELDEIPVAQEGLPLTESGPASAQDAIRPDPFVHLHCHSDYSLLDGTKGPSMLVRAAGNLGQSAVAITDHGRISGVVAFRKAAAWYNKVHAERHDWAGCQKRRAKGDKEALSCHSMTECAGAERCPAKKHDTLETNHEKLPPIKTILGIETYVADAGRTTREKGDWGHLVLLARNEVGYHNLIQLTSLASLEGFYSRPRIDLELLERFGEGLIVLSSCLGGHLAKTLAAKGPQAADDLIHTYQRLVGAENYYLELQWHNDQNLAGTDREHEQHDLNRYLIGAAQRTGAHLVMANDLHYAVRHDAVAEEVVLATQQKMTIAAVREERAKGRDMLWFDTPDFYVKSRREMQQALSDWLGQATALDAPVAEQIRAHGRDWLNETLVIADRIELTKPWVTGKLYFPEFPLPERHLDMNIADPEKRQHAGSDAYLSERVWIKAPTRYEHMDEYTHRLVEYELQAICELGFAPYFLITEDFCDFARAQGVVNSDPIIEVGLGRGSAAGAAVTYILGITDLDPIYYGLSEGGIGFTRFLNPVVHYFAEPSDFGGLPAAFDRTALPAPTYDEMVAELRDELNTAAVARGASLRDGTATDYVTGAPYSNERLELERKRWKEHRSTLLEEWSSLKAMSAFEEARIPLADFEAQGLMSPVEFFWRALQARRAGAPIGQENKLHSYIAPFIGLTTARPAGMVIHTNRSGQEISELPLLPHYRFEQARIGMPDIDIDFTPGYDGREKVMRYITEKYGSDHVAQIATFGTMQAKSAIKDVARAKGLPAFEGDRLAGLIPKKFVAQRGETDEDAVPGVSLREMLTSTHSAVVEGSKELRAEMAADPKVNEIILLAAELEGCKRNVSTHACGVLITPGKVTDYVAVERTDKGTGRQACHDGPTLTDEYGLLKVDFLGLKNLKINRGCVERIEERSGQIVNWRTVPDDDPEAMALLARGQTLGIFQMAGMATGILKQMRPTKVDDLMVTTALGRPGPMEYIPIYLAARKVGHGTYDEPTFGVYAAPILENTYGVLVYQEQMMRLAIKLAGFSLPDSDGLRKATGKKDAEKMASFRDQFVAGAVAKGVNKAWIEDWWSGTLEKFASYAFNFSHSACYAMTAYKQAYLKAHFLPEFYAALMSVDQHETAKVAGATSPLALEIAEARRVGIDVLPIDINRSTDRVEIELLPLAGDEDPRKVVIEGDSRVCLRLSMSAIKGVGEKPVALIMAERAQNGPFSSFTDFVTRVIERERLVEAETGKRLPNPVRKDVIEPLVKVGAFDAYDDRQHLLLALSAYFGTTSVRKKALVSWEPKATYNPGAIKPQDYLDWEHELVGVYTSAHPADGIAEADIEAYEAEVEAHEKTAAYQRSKPVRLLTGHPVADILEHESARDDQLRLIAGMLLNVIWKPNRSGVGGRYCGRIEDSTAGANFTYWKPRDGEIGAAHVAFREFEAAVNEERLNGTGAVLVGAFGFNPKYQKEPELSVYEWKPMALPRMEVAPTLEKLVPVNEAEQTAREAELFGPEPAKLAKAASLGAQGNPVGPEQAKPAKAAPLGAKAAPLGAQDLPVNSEPTKPVVLAPDVPEPAIQTTTPASPPPAPISDSADFFDL
jgi:DNA polymerase III alpha subunit